MAPWRFLNRGDEGEGTTDSMINGGRFDREDECAYSTIRRSVCSLQDDGSGKPIQKCERMEKLLRKCTGRPEEVVESKVECTEEDATNSNLSSFDSAIGEFFKAPKLPGGRQGNQGDDRNVPPFFRGLFDGSGPSFSDTFEEMVQAAEDVVNDVLGGSFGTSKPQSPSHHEQQMPEHPSRFQPKWFDDIPKSSPHQQPAEYAGIGKGFTEV